MDLFRSIQWHVDDACFYKENSKYSNSNNSLVKYPDFFALIGLNKKIK